jgi:hypothetical protein
MVRYIMSFKVPEGREQAAQKIIDNYFDGLQRNGPQGMRSQCYASDEDDCTFVHIKGFKKDSIASQHFRSPLYHEYAKQIAALCGAAPVFCKLIQQQTFESIY